MYVAGVAADAAADVAGCDDSGSVLGFDEEVWVHRELVFVD